jgi:hypothetical protein
MTVERWKDGRSWAVYDERGDLVVVTLYKRGAAEVVRRLSAPRHEETPPPGSLARAGGSGSPQAPRGSGRRPWGGGSPSVPVP